jgi:hypothetical protein
MSNSPDTSAIPKRDPTTKNKRRPRKKDEGKKDDDESTQFVSY